MIVFYMYDKGCVSDRLFIAFDETFSALKALYVEW